MRIAIAALAATAVLGACSTSQSDSAQPDGGDGAPAAPTVDAGAADATSSSTTEAPLDAVASPDWRQVYDLACAERMEVSASGPAPDGLSSISGLAASRRHPGVVWAVEDSLEPAVVTGLDVAGSVLAEVTVDAGPWSNLDWEALDVSELDGATWVHVGDIGDNFGLRTEVRVHSFPEPSLDTRTVRPVTTRLRYPDGRPDAEAMVVVGDVVWILDKVRGSSASLYSAELDLGGAVDEPVDLTLVREVDVDGEQVTGMDLSPDGRLLAVRTYPSLRLHLVEDDLDLAAAFDSPACRTPPPDEPQGESVAILVDRLGLLTVSEDESGGPVDLHLTAPR